MAELQAGLEDWDFIGDVILESPEVELTQRLLGMGFKGELSGDGEWKDKPGAQGHCFGGDRAALTWVALCSSNCTHVGPSWGQGGQLWGF